MDPMSIKIEHRNNPFLYLNLKWLEIIRKFKFYNDYKLSF